MLKIQVLERNKQEKRETFKEDLNEVWRYNEKGTQKSSRLEKEKCWRKREKLTKKISTLVR